MLTERIWGNSIVNVIICLMVSSLAENVAEPTLETQALPEETRQSTLHTDAERTGTVARIKR